MKRILRILGIGVAACLALAVIGAIVNPSGPAAPTDSNTAAPVVTLMVSQPTATPAPPTPISATPTPDTASADKAYADKFISVSSTAAKALTTYGELMTRAGQDATLLKNTDWQVDMATSLASMKFVATSIREMQPTAKFATVHPIMLSMADDLDECANLTVAGLDGNDPAKILEATKHLNNIVAGTQKATEELKKLVP